MAISYLWLPIKLSLELNRNLGPLIFSVRRKIFFARMVALPSQILPQSLKGWVYLVLAKERPIRDVLTSHGPVTLDVVAYQLNGALFVAGNTLPSGKIVC